MGKRIPTRFPLLAALCLLCVSRLPGAEALQLDANQNLFYTLAAINAAGYDEGLDLPDNSPVRAEIRKYLAQQNIEVLPELKQFYRKHLAKPGPQAGVQDLSQYISWSLAVTGPPDFAWKTRDVEVPPDAMALRDLAPLMIDFYRQAHLEDLWKHFQPEYEKELDKYHSPILSATGLIGAYLRAGAGGYLGRSFRVYVELLAAPEQVQTRNYGDDAFVIVTPSEKPRMFDIRHAYLHYQIDPIMIKYGIDLQQKRSLLDLVQLTALDDHYKNDFVLLANESLIKAVECRLDKNKAGIDQAMRQGYIMTAYFAERLPEYEAQDQNMHFFAERMVKDIDLKKEIARISSVKFDAGPLQRKAKQVTVAGPELSPSAETLEKAEDLYSSKNLDKARELFQKALEDRGSGEEHAQAWYGLARIALLENQPDAAVKLFEKTLSGAPDAFTKAWSYVYLARLSVAAGDPARAAKFCQDALSTNGASPKALDAARKELDNIQNKQEIQK